MRNRHFHNIPLLALATAVLTVLALTLSPPASATEGVTEGRTFRDNEFSENMGSENTTVDNYDVRLLLDDFSWIQTTDDNFLAGENLENVEVIGTGTGASVRIDRIGDNWTSVADTPSAVEAGGALVWTGGDNIYALRGNATQVFWRYSISNDNWTPVAPIPESVDWGSGLTWDNGDHIYALLPGGAGILSDNNFWRYSISDNSWTMMPDTPVAGGGGGLSAVWTSGDNIYALRGHYGDPQRDFWRFSISDNSWTSKADTPQAAGWGGDLAWDNSNYIYAIRGTNENDFWRYSISDNSWTSMADTPGTVNEGGQLVWAGGDNIYALRGGTYPNYTKDFWRYSIPKNRWTLMTSTPNTVVRGGSLVWTGGDNIYALRGNNDNVFWRYTIPVFLYDSGAFTSMVYDTGGVASWGTISWDAYTPENTSLEIWTRTSSDNSSWSTWENCVNGNNVPSLENRYIQYRALFSTSDIEIAPVLDEVTINYKKYRSRGTFISQAWDSGSFISSWDNISLDVDIPSGTELTIQTRTSPDNDPYVWSDWENLGVDNVIQSPNNRYLQVRATLTGDNATTPLLHEYTVYYTVWILEVSVSVSPPRSGNLLGENVIFVITVRNIGENDDNYDLTAGDDLGWSWELENVVLEVPAGGSRTTNLTVTISENAELDVDDNITVTATSKTDNTVTDNDNCAAYALPSPGVSVSISPGENEARPGENVTFTVTITNEGNVTDNYDLTVGDNASPSWGPTLDNSIFENVAPGDNRTTTLTVTISPSAENGAEDNVTVTATSQADPGVSGDNSCIARALPVQGVSVSISPGENEARPGENVTFTVTITNEDNVTDTYTLENMDDAGWLLSLGNASLTVPGGENRTTTLTVTIPENAEPCTRDNITITATSQENTEVSDNDTCTAHVVIGRGVSVSISPLEDNGAPGETITFTVTVTNTGDVTNDYELTAYDSVTPSWGPTLADNLLTIPPGENRATTVSVTVPSDAFESDWTRITVTATSQADNAVSASDTCKAVVEKKPEPVSGFPVIPVAISVVIAIIACLVVYRIYWAGR